jgi:hypothetical protein
MKEVIFTMPVLIDDDFDEESLANAAFEQIVDGWQFDKAQMVVIDRPDIDPDDIFMEYTHHRIVTDPNAKIKYERFNR